MKYLVTHINPHLDDVFAIWLLRKFDLKYTEYDVDFISASHNRASEETEEYVFVGTGGGKFDEHKEGLATCAGSLVFDHLKSSGLLPNDELTVKALEKLVEWNKRIDMGFADVSEANSFSVPAFIRSKDNKKESSLEDVSLGAEILDRVLAVHQQNQQSLQDWEGRVEFDSKFGKSIAILSDTVDRVFCKQMGGDLFLMVSPKYHGVQYFTPSHEVDLSEIYHQVKELDPEADWFLHQSHHMVLNGSSAAPDAHPTKLTFEELIEAAKSV